jgi:2-amino-4-hydroxy-6-hydroxymethyldihydropteridine diphosphokinase
MNTAYVALGANLGDPAATVRAAFGALANLPESRVVHCSSLYRTAPVGNTEQPEFINAVAALETTLAPEVTARCPARHRSPFRSHPRRKKRPAHAGS